MRKKLIEVALPLEAINKAAAREKSIRHGHPSTLHLWWARRPLAACRAVLFASLVDDPSSDPMFGGDEDIEASKRAELFNLIEELVQWENSNNPRVINKARAEIARCIASRKIETGELKKGQAIALSEEGGGRALKKYTPHDIKQMLASPEAVNHFLATYGPPVLDPFCGGGSIPLEAQRLGLRAYGSDLNPVAVLITKALIEIPPKFAGMPPVNPEWQRKSREQKAATAWQGAQGLAEDVSYYGNWMRDEAQKRLGHLYPKVRITRELAKDRPDLKEYVGQELTVLAWLWARTVECPNPGCRARSPLLRSFWLYKKKGRECYAAPRMNSNRKTLRFEVSFSGEPPRHTTDRSGARCLFCDTYIKKHQLRDIASERGVQPVPVAVVLEGRRERLYLPGEAALTPHIEIPFVPFLEQLITDDKRWFSPPLYGMPRFADLFTPRQLVTLTTFCDLVYEVQEKIRFDQREVSQRERTDLGSEDAYSNAIATYLGLVAAKASVFLTTLARWRPGEGKSAPAFGRQAIPMVWDYTDINPFAGAGGDLGGIIDGTVKTLLKIPADVTGVVEQLDAAATICRVDNPMICTDPPYYDNIGYADLSDYFYIWLRRALGKTYPSLFATVLTPKTQELIASTHRHNGDKEKAKSFFECGLGKAFSLANKTQSSEYPFTVYYAFKQSETEEDDEVDGDDAETTAISVSTGWETMLEGLIRAGFAVTGTWPSRTEGGTRLIAMGTNALASSVLMVCRRRSKQSPLATRKELINSLRKELPVALRDLQAGSIAPVDLAQAAIGPGMAVFSGYARVIESDGSPMTVRTALGLINQALDEVLAEQEGEFDTDTRWALAWFEQFGMDEGPFGVAETLSKAKVTAVNGLVEAGIVKARGGKVRLLKRDELPEAWEPSKDKRLTIWEVSQQLIRTLDQKGESEAAALLHKLGGLGEAARDLAYRLYTICERKKWADEALAYNGLVIAWPELTKLAQAERSKSPATQNRMFE